MEQLRDDVILVVLELLPLEDLLSCRLVCKRLADLALAPDVWRRRKIIDYRDRIFHQKKCYVCPALRLAPRVHMMSIELSKKPRHAPYATTKCAAVELSVHVDGSAYSARAATQVIRNQADLGRLQRLGLVVDDDAEPDAEPDLSLLLQTVASAFGLKDLSVSHWWTHKDLTRLRAVASTFSYNTELESSLTRFRCDVQLGPFENFVLAAHAATLESVCISTPSPSTAELLAAAPKLRTLIIPLLTGMEALVACQSLSAVRLEGGFNVTAGDTAKLPGAAQFFRGADQLSEVRLQYVDPCDGVDLVRALAASGRSRVEELSLDCSNGPALGEVQPLLDALASLRALRCLELTSLVDGKQAKKLLLSISSETAPALRSLILAPTGRLRCAHSWAHSGVTKAVLTANPLLHIQMAARTHGRGADTAKNCRTCSVKKCHDVYEWDWQDLKMSSIFVGLSTCNDDRHCFEKYSSNSDNVFWCQVDL